MRLTTLKRRLHIIETKIRRAAPVLAAGGATAAIAIQGFKAEIAETTALAMKFGDASVVRDSWTANLDALGTALASGSKEAVIDAATILYQGLNTGHDQMAAIFQTSIEKEQLVGFTDTGGQVIMPFVSFFSSII